MRTVALVVAGVVVGWAAADVDWARVAYGEDKSSEAQVKQTTTFEELVKLIHAPEGAVAQPLAESASVTLSYGGENVRSVMQEVQNPAGFNPSPTSSSQPPGNLIGRYQISAYGWSGGHGCYIIDTMTGKSWHAAHERQTAIVTESLQTEVAQPPAMMPTPAYQLPTDPPRRESGASSSYSQPLTTEPTPDDAD